MSTEGADEDATHEVDAGEPIEVGTSSMTRVPMSRPCVCVRCCGRRPTPPAT